MKHLIFPTVAQADAFVADLRAQGAIQPETRDTTWTRRSGTTGDLSASGTSTGASSMTNPRGSTTMNDTAYDTTTGASPAAEDAGAGAVAGTGVGAVVGAIAGTVATVATGGLAAPMILGMAALGSGVGAGVGAVGGAAGVDENNDGRTADNDAYATRTGSDMGMGRDYDYSVSDEAYDRMDQANTSGGRSIAVDDNVDQAVLDAAVQRHGGQYV
ncbi:hypothetical protein [Deinococcus sp. Leaf326]|jgi:hypothetical protein|uniref:hypothetical protein n=1 Tax=Deinococcus sp. Leaf326 TaxID=1736338 RepID=UPI000700449B|nr:hypothetical protein [Deinococcus sp. Leaf326]KQR15648.1 hypothetical protein ASF71_08420 [Deinococcus sp. Leaf326]